MNQTGWQLDLGLSAFRVERNKFLLVLSHLIYDSFTRGAQSKILVLIKISALFAVAYLLIHLASCPL